MTYRFHIFLGIWFRPANQPVVKNVSSTVTFEIPFASPGKNWDSNSKQFVLYTLSVRYFLSQDSNPVVIHRRYNHFRQLYQQLCVDHQDIMQSVNFPRRVLFGNFSSQVIAERSNAFEIFLNYIVESSVLRESQHFIQFLQGIELIEACRLLDERKNEQAVPILEGCFRLLNKVSFLFDFILVTFPLNIFILI